jgi:hypothetical protein
MPEPRVGSSAPHRSRLVCYSIVVAHERLAEHAFQFELSVRSLRAHNAAVPAVLFVYGDFPRAIELTCRRFGVMVHQQGPYEERLRACSAHGAGALARYPVLHKQLNFAELVATGVEQVLCCDLDTLFLGDVDGLFDRYGGADVVAREEVFSRRSIHGVDPAFIDEELLATMAASLGRRFVAPFNVGIVMYSRALIRMLASMMDTFVDDAWRILCGEAACEPARSSNSGPSTFPWMDDVRTLMRDGDLRRALPMPSTNGWIVEEIALWLTLGAIPGWAADDFSHRDVAQGGELLFDSETAATWSACHYYSVNTSRVAEWLRSSRRARALVLAA